MESSGKRVLLLMDSAPSLERMLEEFRQAGIEPVEGISNRGDLHAVETADTFPSGVDVVVSDSILWTGVGALVAFGYLIEKLPEAERGSVLLIVYTNRAEYEVVNGMDEIREMGGVVQYLKKESRSIENLITAIRVWRQEP